MELEAHADGLPSMGGAEIGPWLRQWAKQCTDGAIVEVGSWLGAGTAQLALGARESGAPIHTFDRWTANEAEVAKAARFGVELVNGQDTLPWVREQLAPFGAQIMFHRGSVEEAVWDGRPIGLYVDDAGKRGRQFRRKMATFQPHFIDGCIVVLMDYFFFEEAGWSYGAQRRWVSRRRSQFLLQEDHVGGTSTAVFRYASRGRR